MQHDDIVCLQAVESQQLTAALRMSASSGVDGPIVVQKPSMADPCDDIDAALEASARVTKSEAKCRKDEQAKIRDIEEQQLAAAIRCG